MVGFFWSSFFFFFGLITIRHVRSLANTMEDHGVLTRKKAGLLGMQYNVFYQDMPAGASPTPRPPPSLSPSLQFGFQSVWVNRNCMQNKWSTKTIEL